MRQIKAQIELQLVVVRCHVRAQPVEGLVVLGFLQVRQLMHHDHLQEFSRGIAEHAGDADLAAGLEPVALHPGNARVGAERVFHDLQLAVVEDLAQRNRLAQIPVLERLHVVVQLAIAAHGVQLAILVVQHLAQPALRDQRVHPRQHVGWIASEVLQRSHQQDGWKAGEGREV
jgi:hypothetical protein